MPFTSLKKLPFLLVAAALLAFPALAGSTVHAAKRTSAESSLLHEINRVRRAHHLRTLRYDSRLAVAAHAHTTSMASGDYFAHGTFAQRMVRFHVRGPFVGENLAWGTGSRGTAAGIVRAWLASPEHRANLLRPGFRRIGLGEIRTTFEGAAGASVVTADFAGF